MWIKDVSRQQKETSGVWIHVRRKIEFVKIFYRILDCFLAVNFNCIYIYILYEQFLRNESGEKLNSKQNKLLVHMGLLLALLWERNVFSDVYINSQTLCPGQNTPPSQFLYGEWLIEIQSFPSPKPVSVQKSNSLFYYILMIGGE